MTRTVEYVRDIHVNGEPWRSARITIAWFEVPARDGGTPIEMAGDVVIEPPPGVKAGAIGEEVDIIVRGLWSQGTWYSPARVTCDASFAFTRAEWESPTE